MTTGIPVAVIGGGPVGLAAAAHLVERAIPFVLFEAGPDIGASVSEWGHVQFFSPWRYSIDPAAARLLAGTGWNPPEDDVHPTGGEIIDRYLRPLAGTPAIRDHIRLHHRVVAVGRLGMDKLEHGERHERPFAVTVDGPDGRSRYLARAVIDATGTWDQPNPLGADGFEALGEDRFGERITYGIPDVRDAERSRYAGRRVAVVGSGHSAQNVVRDLAMLAVSEPNTEITWVLRRSAPGQMFGGGGDDQLPERGRLGSDARRLVDSGQVSLVPGFRVDAIDSAEADGVVLRSVEGSVLGPFDEVVAATGFRPDLSFLRELRLDLDPALESTKTLAPLIDPNVHSCGTVPPHGESELRHPETGVYLVGMKSYGRAPSFLLATGYEQVRSVAAYLAGDVESARRVELVLPETGVCSTDDVQDPASACCGSPLEVVPAPGGQASCCG
ncbi:MAG: NAD(P)-binding domain-containing protein [Acidimicrobiia bacterium]